MRTLLTSWLLAITLAIGAKAQQPSAVTPNAETKHDADLHARALVTLQAERARARQSVCTNILTDHDTAVCLNKELAITDGNEARLVRALGAILRSGAADMPAAKAQPFPFDAAETTWHLYREQACKADAGQGAGGTLELPMEVDCELSLTRRHMEELWSLYGKLGS